MVDTHAGAGRYLLPAEALATGEAAALRRLLAAEDAPAVFGALKRAVAPQGEGVVYPGSPLLAAARLRADDRLIACELRPDDGADLAAALRPYGPRAEARLTDGYAALPPALRAWPGRALVLIDPPFERGDDYARLAETTRAALAAKPGATILIWTPLKDLETFDALVRALEAGVAAPGLVAELRLRPPLDPLRLNGCGLIMLNPPTSRSPRRRPGPMERADLNSAHQSPGGEMDPGLRRGEREGGGADLQAALESAGAWLAHTLGEPGGGARVRHLATANKGGAQGRRSRL